MPKPHQTRHIVVRGAVLSASATTAILASAFGTEFLGVPMILAIHAAAFLAGLVIRTHRLTGAVRLGLLTCDLVALGAVGFLIAVPARFGWPARVTFLSAFVVATLVSVVGLRMRAAVFGMLAGFMVLGLGHAFLIQQGIQPMVAPLIAQVVWVTLAAVEAALVAGWVHRETQWRQLNRNVERELRSREAEAAELVSFTQGLADSTNLQELAEAVLRHLRCHLTVQARAVVVESEGDEIAIWEEAGRLEAEDIERRRVSLQEALARSGSSYMIRRVQGRSLSNRDVPENMTFLTHVEIPVRVGGRVAGVLCLADGERGVLPPHRIGIIADVARRLGESMQRLERQRDQENRRTALLLRQMREGVLLLGPDGQVLLANPAAQTALDASAEANEADSIGGIALQELGGTPPGIVRRFRANMPAEGGDTAELACTAVGILDRGKRVGTLVTLADVTEEELARRRLVQAEKMTLVGQTLAGVAHELNNPLAALIGYADLLKVQHVPENIERPVRQMREQAIRATRIVRNLLNFARRRNPERVPTRLADLIDGTVELFAYEARMANVEVVLEVAEELPTVLADKHALQQILVNLMQNALHALERWDGERKITLTARTVGDALALYVRDSGPGVSEELRTRVFQPFFTTKGAKRGTGLGLALSMSVARDHGGDLTLEPDSGSGACFVLRLPMHQAGAVPTNGQSEPVEQERRAVPYHILVVDDEPSVRDALVQQLGNMGSQVDSAANSAEAERMLSDERYDAVLLDVRMPGMSGLELHRALRERNPGLAQRIVFMTGDFVNDDVLGQVLETGNKLLEKPFTMDELTRALDQRQQPPSAPNFTLTA